MREITEEKIKKYLDTTSRAIGKIKVSVPENSHLKKIAEDFLSMALNYYKDAEYFYNNGDYVNAFAAVNYAHGWLDAGARLGLFNVENDYKLFTLYY
ncbi:MAG: DUF357 domain-containing protein [Thermoplasmata archaeon]